MIYIQPLRKNDINPSMGKQYEFGKAFFSSFGWEGGTTHEIIVHYKNRTIKTSVKVRGDERGGERVGADGKEYAIDGKLPLKDLLINTLNLNESHVGVVTLIFEALNNNGSEFNLYTVPEKIPFTLSELNFQQDWDLPLQQIIFGAPGTGKSYSVDRETNGYNVFRTTFHPDSDYSTFVGTYKPIMVEKPVMTTIGTKRVQVEDANGMPVTESQIEYKFVPQAFAQAYVKAWQDVEQPVFLIIEEINRGNCAQIFGDIFQLLDRRSSGYSSYPITPDNDLQQYLCKVFEEEGIDDRAFTIIRNGESMSLPPNLFIWATMNTSDQSLFPIDSAFKRRWEWKYIKIKDEHKDWKIEANGSQFDWWDFLEFVNTKIGESTSSEDKKLGYFFAKADKNGVISAATFVSKVIFYLTNDVFKDYDTDIFNVNDRTLTFQDFFDENGNVDEAVLEEFMREHDITEW